MPLDYFSLRKPTRVPLVEWILAVGANGGEQQRAEEGRARRRRAFCAARHFAPLEPLKPHDVARNRNLKSTTERFAFDVRIHPRRFREHQRSAVGNCPAAFALAKLAA